MIQLPSLRCRWGKPPDDAAGTSHEMMTVPVLPCPTFRCRWDKPLDDAPRGTLPMMVGDCDSIAELQMPLMLIWHSIAKLQMPLGKRHQSEMTMCDKDGCITMGDRDW